MANRISIRVRRDGTRVYCDYTVHGPWSSAFNTNAPTGWFGEVGLGEYRFWIDYDEDIEDVPESILCIPFLCNIMPIAWVFNARVFVESVDMDFARSLEDVRFGFAELYPELAFGGELVAGRFEKNHLGYTRSPPIVLFSGGVDAVFAAVGNRALKPILFTLWGADIFFKNEAAWRRVDEENSSLASSLGMGYCVAKSTFRLFLNYKPLNEIVSSIKDNWWHGIQHGLGIIGHASVLAWARGADHIVFASSFSRSDRSFLRASSMPTTDQRLNFGGIVCRHYDYNVSRQEKVEYICEEAFNLGVRLPLRVCWRVLDGKNCCVCEKCLRTIYAIYSCDADPGDHGFVLTDEKIAKIVNLFESGEISKNPRWPVFVEQIRKNAKLHKLPHVAAMLRLYDT